VVMVLMVAVVVLVMVVVRDGKNTRARGYLLPAGSG